MKDLLECHYSTHTTAPLGVWVGGEREGEGLISRAHVHGGRRGRR